MGFPRRRRNDSTRLVRRRWRWRISSGFRMRNGRGLRRCCRPIRAGCRGSMTGACSQASCMHCSRADAGAIVPSRSMARRRHSTTASCAGRNAGYGNASSRRLPEPRMRPTGCSSTAPASRFTAPPGAQKGGLGQWYRPDAWRQEHQATRRLRREGTAARPPADARQCP